ncbi:MAG: hypothetical protein KC496_15400, partial [Anaerolineae bacterium]|nr:hypothetical protein [Anaerolineae bacterium]
MLRKWMTIVVYATVAAVVVGTLMGVLALALTGFGLSNKLILVAVGGLGSILILLVVRNVRYLLLIAIFIDLATAMDFHIACNEDYFLSVCGINVSVTALALIILYVLWVKDIYRENRSRYERSPRLSAIGWLNVGFLLAGLLSVMVAPNTSFAFYQLWLYFYLFALFFYLANHIKSLDDVIFVIMMLIAGLFLQNVLMEMQSVGLLVQSEREVLLNRAVGTLQSPNAAGGYLSQMIVIAFAMLGLRLSPRQRWVLIAIIGVALANLISTESRGGWTSMLIGVSIVTVMSLRKRWFSYKALLGLVFGAAIFMVFFSSAIIARLTEDDNGSA